MGRKANQSFKRTFGPHPACSRSCNMLGAAQMPLNSGVSRQQKRSPVIARRDLIRRRLSEHPCSGSPRSCWRRRNRGICFGHSVAGAHCGITHAGFLGFGCVPSARSSQDSAPGLRQAGFGRMAWVLGRAPVARASAALRATAAAAPGLRPTFAAG